MSRLTSVSKSKCLASVSKLKCLASPRSQSPNVSPRSQNLNVSPHLGLKVQASCLGLEKLKCLASPRSRNKSLNYITGDHSLELPIWRPLIAEKLRSAEADATGIVRITLISANISWSVGNRSGNARCTLESSANLCMQVCGRSFARDVFFATFAWDLWHQIKLKW